MKIENIIYVEDIEIHICRKHRLKNINISIKPPNGEVYVSASFRVSEMMIKDFVLKKNLWIKKSIEKVKQRKVIEPLFYVSGEKIVLWGKEYILEIIDSEKVSLEKTYDKIIMKVKPNYDKEKKEKIIFDLYKKELLEKIDLYGALYEGKMKIKVNRYIIRDMKSRWGTCNYSKKNITINLQLVKRPIECLEYVIVHELSHLFCPHHNAEFYAIVDKFYPHRKSAEKILKS